MANLPRSPFFRARPQPGNAARSYVLAALVIGGVTTLSIAAWPLPPFLWELLPERSRDLLGQVPALRAGAAALALAALLTAAAVGRLWRFLPTGLGWRILGAWAVAVLLVAFIVAALWLVLGLPGLDTTPTVSPKALDSIATRAFAIVAGLGGVALLVIAYQRQSGEQTRLFTERFTTAVGQLGEDQPAVRLGGVHALAHLADDAPTPGLRQMCVDVLCAYLRNPGPDDLPQGSTDDQKQTHHDRVVEHAAMREVRLTIARTISHRLRTPTPWQDCDYDFTGVTFESPLDLNGAVCQGRMTFVKTTFTSDAGFGDVTFTGDAD
ncbi:pentapeptide repeat-containing protein, partial [Nocardiopsis flavescens]|uniref:pentapeptide repeat-containing protein n=1 Tax=Nocardiopsis flavescens TaxID=758803 RepID=UPI0015BD66C4